MRILFLFVFVFVAKISLFSQTQDTIQTDYDTLSTTVETDSTCDSIVLIHQKTVVKKQIVVGNNSDDEFQNLHSFSFFSSIAKLYNYSKFYENNDSSKYLGTKLLRINRFRALYSKMLNTNWQIGGGIGLKNIRLKTNFERSQSQYKSYKEIHNDTLDIYYVETNGIKVPHYIIGEVEVKRTDTITTRSKRDTITTLGYVTVPLQITYLHDINEWSYWGFSLLLEPGILCYDKGIIASQNGLLATSSKTITSFTFDTQCGLKAGIYLTPNLSLDLLVYYTFSTLRLSQYIPQSFIRNQIQTNLGFSYTF